MSLFRDEAERVERFPVAARHVFVGHAGVTALPRCVADAMTASIRASSENHQEFGDVLRDVGRARGTCAKFIGARADEIALLGPTSLGLSLFANGIEWREGDEVLVYRDDYPANVYPWMALRERGVVLRWLEPETPGNITVETIDRALTPRTRLAALASCHFLTGWRLDVDAVGALLRGRGVLFSLDAIQTLGAFPLDVAAVDFLSADAHKWMLGPVTAGIVYVAREHFATVRPTLLGAWNVRSPEFVTQDEIVFADSGQRYEPGVLNIPGIFGMVAALEMLSATGMDMVAERILANRDHLEERLRAAGFVFLSPSREEPSRSGILTCRHPDKDPSAQFAALEKAGVSASLRTRRDGARWLRFSPHFYNTREEMERIAGLLI